MGITAGHEALVEDELGGLEAGLDVAVAPFLGRLAGRQLVVAGRGKITRFPLQGLQVDLRRRDIAVRARIGAAREQALQRIGHVRQLLEIDLDRLDRVGRGGLALGCDRQDRMPHIEHLVL